MRDFIIEAMTFILLGLSVFLFFQDILPLWTVPFIWMIVISARYQIFGRIYLVNQVTVRLKMEDKFFNEFQYQIKKHGYKVKLFYVGNDKLDFKTSAPPFTARYCKFITFVKMFWSPGWGYRELEDEIDPIPINSKEEARAYEV